jgi:hypothetical protein
MLKKSKLSQDTGDSQSISEEDDSELSTYASEEPTQPQTHPALRRQKTQQVSMPSLSSSMTVGAK